MTPAEGDTYTYERTFDESTVRAFADLTEDDQPRHTDPDDRGRVLVHGLLTGSLLTKIGGDLGMLAREMTFHFRRPVYSGETVRCTWTNESVTGREDGWLVEASVVFRRVDASGSDGDGGDGDTVVLRATVEGLVED